RPRRHRRRRAPGRRARRARAIRGGAVSYEEYGPPDGYCVDCGAETEQEHHWRCRKCFAEQQGWTVRDEDEAPAGALAHQRADREGIFASRALERIADLEARVAELERRAAPWAAMGGTAA